MKVSAALIVFWLTTLPAAAAASDATTPFELLDDGSIVVGVTIGGTSSYRFLVDTGSSRTVISPRLWRALRAPAVAQTIVVTPAGRESAYIVRIEALAIANQPARRVDAAVLKADRHAGGLPVDGLIGQDVLSPLVYTIDYDARLIVWHSAKASMPGVRLPLTVRDNRVLVSLAQRDHDAAPLALIPDSGSDRLVLFAHVTDRLRMTPVDSGVLSSLAGSRSVRRVQLQEMVIGPARFERPLAVIVESEEPVDAMGDGLLPLHLFARVTFNVAERYLIVAAR